VGLLVDRLDQRVPGLAIARRARSIALQSVRAGLGFSTRHAGGAFAHLVPVQGARLQEAIDLAVIVNALRALGGGGSRPGAREAAGSSVA
jgi:hypothetical protein